MAQSGTLTSELIAGRAYTVMRMKSPFRRASSQPHPLPRSYARRLLTLGERQSLDDWLKSLPTRANDVERSRKLAAQLGSLLEAPPAPPTSQAGDGPVESLTFRYTAKRSFEIRYWNTIRTLAAGRFVNKCNADCVRDPITRKMLRHHHRDLEALGDYLLAYCARVFSVRGMDGNALVGELPFQWRTDFDFDWSGGWLNNRLKRTHERNL